MKPNPLDPSTKPSITHQVYSKVLEGWSKALINDIRLYQDNWSTKIAIFFVLDSDTKKNNPLMWLGPIVATPKNKTGKLLLALGYQIEEGVLTNTQEIIGRTVWVKTIKTTTPDGIFYKITNFNAVLEGSDLFGSESNSSVGNTDTTRKTKRYAQFRTNGTVEPVDTGQGTDKSNNSNRTA